MRVISHALPVPSRAPYTPLRYQAVKYIVLLDMKTQVALPLSHFPSFPLAFKRS